MAYSIDLEADDYLPTTVIRSKADLQGIEVGYKKNIKQIFFLNYHAKKKLPQAKKTFKKTAKTTMLKKPAKTTKQKKLQKLPISDLWLSERLASLQALWVTKWY